MNEPKISPEEERRLFHRILTESKEYKDAVDRLDATKGQTEERRT